MARVMVVDDEKLVRWSISNGLRKDGHEVVCAQDGEEAVGKAKEFCFDVAITDLRMPGMHGTEVLEILKRLCPETKVMILTAYSGELSREAAIERGACEYMEKPFVVDEIRDTVRKVLLTSDRSGA